jgi:hypothetical protein
MEHFTAVFSEQWSPATLLIYKYVMHVRQVVMICLLCAIVQRWGLLVKQWQWQVMHQRACQSAICSTKGHVATITPDAFHHRFYQG